ncbi:MAG: pentapeptide repeat-containing protein [Bryobacterales bacterium]
MAVRMDDLYQCYRVLELEPGASMDEIRESWRDLVQVWHPDRFRDNKRLRIKAEERIKQINLAYDALKNGRDPGPIQPREDTVYGPSRFRKSQEPDIYETLAEGVQSWNMFRKKWSNIRPTLAGRDLQGRAFEGIDFRECNLAASDLSRTDLYKANLSYARLNGAKLVRADLNRAMALEAELEEADLSEANLASADLRGARLVRATLRNANLLGARLKGANLSGATDLRYEQIEHAEIDGATKLPSHLM